MVWCVCVRLYLLCKTKPEGSRKGSHFLPESTWELEVGTGLRGVRMHSFQGYTLPFAAFNVGPPDLQGLWEVLVA